VSDAALELTNVRKSYALRRTSLWQPPPQLSAVRDVSLRLARGETLGLVGESGCGKSTLGRIALTMTRPSGGTVRLGGVDPFAARASVRRRLRRSIQSIFQDPASALDPRFTIAQSIGEPLAAGGMARSARRRAVGELMELVGLDPARMDAHPRQLSGGQRQRVLIARALAPKPTVIVADEPVSALDVSVQAQILNLFRDLQAQLHTSTLFISHDLAVVGFVADRVAVMYLGEIVELGPAADVLTNPLHPYTQLLHAASTSSSTSASTIDTEVGVAAEVAGCPFRARCPRARERCSIEAPALRTVNDQRQVACHFSEL
jgi:oligopeptide/dipeptide ABC transporter ATP-binding protein